MSTAINIPEIKLLRACHTLFGANPGRSAHSFLSSLHPCEVKTAYRRRAKETHPDLFFGLGPDIQQRQSALFQEVLDSYNLFQDYFFQRNAFMHPAFTGSYAQRASHDGKPFPRDPGEHSATDKSYNLYFGSVPPSRFVLGRYLYYRGKVSYATIIKALAWQRTHRPAIGEVAVRWGWLNEPGVQRMLAHKGKPYLSGERAVHLGLLTNQQVRTLLTYQRMQQKKIGQYFVEIGLLSQNELENLVMDLQSHNQRFSRTAAGHRAVM